MHLVTRDFTFPDGLEKSVAITVEFAGPVVKKISRTDTGEELALARLDPARIGSFHPLESNKGWKLAEVVRHVTMARPVAYTTAFFVVMNKKKWDALAKEDQGTIEAINREWALKHGQAWDSSDEEGKQFFIDRKGNTLVDLDPQETARWKTAVEPMIAAYVEKLDKDGLNGKAAVEMIQQTLKKHE
jgi:TRAP-type C4-dicarboxylate transport system substrate-binding protein